MGTRLASAKTSERSASRSCVGAVASRDPQADASATNASGSDHFPPAALIVNPPRESPDREASWENTAIIAS
jgi:hypothetical protein